MPVQALQPNSNPGWGTFSSMRLDPDGCTFWYAQEYYQASPAIDWSTQIASVRFANCRNPAYNGYIELCKQTDPVISPAAHLTSH